MHILGSWRKSSIEYVLSRYINFVILHGQNKQTYIVLLFNIVLLFKHYC